MRINLIQSIPQTILPVIINSSDGSASITKQTLSKTVTTTDGTTYVTIETIPLNISETIRITANIIGKNKTNNDSVTIEIRRTFKNISSVVSEIGSQFKIVDNDTGTYDAKYTISGTDVLLQVRGVDSQDVVYSSDTQIYKIS